MIGTQTTPDVTKALVFKICACLQYMLETADDTDAKYRDVELEIGDELENVIKALIAAKRLGAVTYSRDLLGKLREKEFRQELTGLAVLNMGEHVAGVLTKILRENGVPEDICLEIELKAFAEEPKFPQPPQETS